MFDFCFAASPEFLVRLSLFDIDLHFLLNGFIRHELKVFLEFLLNLFLLLFFRRCHSLHPQSLLSLLLDQFNFFHGLDGLDPESSIVSNWNVATLLEFVDGVTNEFFASESARSLGPLDLPGISFCFEELMTLRPAEMELLYS